ncbi:MAG: hypothetical protein DRJ07_02655 [Bacteroidetes bacterium]|nr:MAG: hypothetical protein DRJ07_02655 [Bacteroidota bacterium]
MDNNSILSIPELSFMENGIDKFTEQYLINNSNYTILIHVDGTCFYCINDIRNMNIFFKNLKLVDTKIYYLLHFEQDTVLLKYFLKNIEVNFPIAIDYYNDFYFTNKKITKNEYSIYLLNNRKMKILFYGHPVHKKKDSLSFLRKLHRLDLVN